jgi:hypothetical protein
MVVVERRRAFVVVEKRGGERRQAGFVTGFPAGDDAFQRVCRPRPGGLYQVGVQIGLFAHVLIGALVKSLFAGFYVAVVVSRVRNDVVGGLLKLVDRCVE